MLDTEGAHLFIRLAGSLQARPKPAASIAVVIVMATITPAIAGRIALFSIVLQILVDRIQMIESRLFFPEANSLMRKSIGIVLALATLTACSPRETAEDPHLWLEEVEG